MKYKPNFYQVRLMLFYGTIFKIIKYKNLKIKYSIQIYQVHQAILTKIKYSWSHFFDTKLFVIIF